MKDDNIISLRNDVIRAQEILNSCVLTESQVIANMICNHFGIAFYTDLAEKGRHEKVMWTSRFICLILSALFNPSQEDLGDLIHKSRATARWHLIKIVDFIKLNDKLAVRYFEELIVLFAANGYEVKKFRSFISEFDQRSIGKSFDRQRTTALVGVR